MAFTTEDLSDKEQDNRDICPVTFSDQEGLFIPLTTIHDVIITPWREDDIDDMVDLYNHPSVARYAVTRPIPYTYKDASFLSIEIANTRSFLDELPNRLPTPPSKTSYPHGEISPFGAVRIRDTQKLIGSLHVRPSGYSPGNWEISYYLNPNYTRRGIGSEMIRKGVQLAKWLGVERIVAFTAAENIPSNVVLKKTGFTIYSDHIIDWPEFLGGGKKDVYTWDQYLVPFEGKGPPIVEG
ncbi:uncharacterized protein IL334_000050 [Kwoniella shivajii]|uniref:N-acetyltransferase domain-containing protein n=1 Tax=Kwoniella shivajii TaxID=564305 RepID=A0ABZ1CS99_9TREE|nr:hypothetical protein IL334_000050 [Kwoniella shivajii]